MWLCTAVTPACTRPAICSSDVSLRLSIGNGFSFLCFRCPKHAAYARNASPSRSASSDDSWRQVKFFTKRPTSTIVFVIGLGSIFTAVTYPSLKKDISIFATTLKYNFFFLNKHYYYESYQLFKHRCKVINGFGGGVVVTFYNKFWFYGFFGWLPRSLSLIHVIDQHYNNDK